MPVVAAGVHLAGDGAGVGQAGLLLDRQRIHVGADAECLAAVTLAQGADQASRAQAAMHGVAPRRQLLGDQVAGAALLEGEFGMGVDLVADPDELGRDGLDGLPQAGGGGLDHGCRHTWSSGLFSTPLVATSMTMLGLKRCINSNNPKTARRDGP
ncbi:hypothetical protein D9M72_454160 [compost metagenome]